MSCAQKPIMKNWLCVFCVCVCVCFYKLIKWLRWAIVTSLLCFEILGFTNQYFKLWTVETFLMDFTILKVLWIWFWCLLFLNIFAYYVASLYFFSFLRPYFHLGIFLCCIKVYSLKEDLNLLTSSSKCATLWQFF